MISTPRLWYLQPWAFALCFFCPRALKNHLLLSINDRPRSKGRSAESWVDLGKGRREQRLILCDFTCQHVNCLQQKTPLGSVNCGCNGSKGGAAGQRCPFKQREGMGSLRDCCMVRPGQLHCPLEGPTAPCQVRCLGQTQVSVRSWVTWLVSTKRS